MNATELELPPEGHMATVNDIEMYYEIHGEGPPLVLLHHYFGTSRRWQPFIPDLAKEYQLIAPDLRGHGRSTNPSNRFSQRQCALDVHALLDQLEIERFRAIGVSAGGMTLIHMATQQPARIEAMVLVSATSYLPEQARAFYRQSRDESRWNWDRLRETHVLGDAQIRTLHEIFYNYKDNYDDINFTPPYLSTITAKTLIVHGDRDGFFPVSIPVEMYTSIPHAYLWIVPNAGHMPMGGKHQAAFTQAALEFLRGEWDK